MNFCFTVASLWAARQHLFQHLEHLLPLVLLFLGAHTAHSRFYPLTPRSSSFLSLSWICFHRGTLHWNPLCPEMGLLEPAGSSLPLLTEPMCLPSQHLCRDSCHTHQVCPQLPALESFGCCVTAQESSSCSLPSMSKSTKRDYLWSQKGLWQE